MLLEGTFKNKFNKIIDSISSEWYAVFSSLYYLLNRVFVV